MNSSVLIVENEPLVREAMEDILDASGFKPIGTGSGLEGIAAYRANRDEIALVILDMRLPGMDGPDVLKALRCINPDVKAIISSAYEEHEIRQSFNGEPVTCILKKPFNARSLLTSVREALDD